MQDWELLADYLRTGSQSAFAEVVERYINLVYATCLREIKDPQLAEDATQAVFIILLKKAHTIRPGTVLSSWFFSTARYVALDAVRHEGRRQRREQKAAAIMIQDLGTPGSNLDWERIEPLLHEALAHLNQDDRNAVLLRYFEGKSLKQTGLAMGISEDAARLRVARAVERMRGFFARHGFSVGAAVLVGLIYDHAVSAAPASCHAAVLQLGSRLMAPANMGVSAMVAGAGPSGGIIVGLTTDAVNVRVLSLVDRVSRLMLMNHIKIATTACAGLALILCGAGKLAHLARASAPPTVTVMGRPMHHAAAPRALTIHKPLRLAEALVPYGHKASDQAGEDIQAGEIQVEGRIHSVDTKHKTLVVDVASFTLPDGKTHELNPVKAKTITLSDGTVLHVRGAEQHVVTLTALKDLGDGVFAIAVGRDLGSGHALPARDVGVWTRVQAGRPLFDPPQKPRDTEGDPALDPGQPVVLAPAFRPAPPGAATKPAGAAPAPSGQRVASPESILGVGAGAAPAPTLTHASAVNATAILTQLWTITANTQFYRPSILAALAYHDPAAALTLVADPPDPIPDAMLGPIAVAAAEGDPEHAARWAPEHLRQLQLPFWRFRATARTAVLLADKEPEVAMELYRMAQDAYNDTTAEVPVNHGNNAERLATLSWLAHKLNREDEAKPFDAALVREIKAMRYRPWWILQQLYALAPRQDLMLLNQITAPDRQAGKDESPTAILFAAMIAARFDPPRAKLLFSGVLPALTQQDPGAVGRDEDAAPAATGSTGELLVRSLDARTRRWRWKSHARSTMPMCLTSQWRWQRRRPICRTTWRRNPTPVMLSRCILTPIGRKPWRCKF